jgi:predicted DsbA family dithiol-disulfide isomerase
VLETRGYREAVDGDWSRSREMGIRAVPTFLIDHEVLVGAQPYEVIEAFLKEHGVKRRRPNP